MSSGAAGFGQRTHAVDWEAVDDELFHMAPEFKDPRFDSLHHVLSILGAVDSEAALDEVFTTSVLQALVCLKALLNAKGALAGPQSA